MAVFLTNSVNNFSCSSALSSLSSFVQYSLAKHCRQTSKLNIEQYKQRIYQTRYIRCILIIYSVLPYVGIIQIRLTGRRSIFLSAHPSSPLPSLQIRYTQKYFLSMIQYFYQPLPLLLTIVNSTSSCRLRKTIFPALFSPIGVITAIGNTDRGDFHIYEILPQFCTRYPFIPCH